MAEAKLNASPGRVARSNSFGLGVPGSPLRVSRSGGGGSPASQGSPHGTSMRPRGTGSPARPPPAGKAFKAVYYGSVVFPETPNKESVQKAVETAKRNAELAAEAHHKVLIVVSDKIMKVVDHATKDDLQVVAIGMLAYCTQDPRDPNIVVYATRTADTRLNVIIGHVFAVQNRKVAAAVTTAVRQAFAALPAGERVQANESPYVMVGGDAGIAADTKMFDALYLGYVRVSKQEGAKMIKKAAEVNAASREAMAKMRQSKGARKSSLLQGGGAATRHGTAVEEDPITIIITPRSLRIIDRLAGETVFKFLLPNITFATSSKGSKHDTFGCVVHNEQLGITNCHLFYTTPGAGAGLGQAVASAISEYQRRFGGISMSGNPWEVLPDAKREAAPEELFQKQVHRRDLQALAIIGAGEYGEVYLALQAMAARTPDGTDVTVTVPRAVKMLKGAATEKIKQEYIREAITMLRVGEEHDGVVRMVGVAVQQAPWLVVLEFVQFGDLRAVLQAYTENSEQLTTGEMIRTMRQLASACGYIISKRIVHMDLAARNVLLGIGNNVKVGDFGMAREMASDGDYVILREKVPLALKWNSIEAMDSRFFSEASDCWSLGVLMWEILTYGEFPYPGVRMEDIQNLVRGGLRLAQPATCPQDLWVQIAKCWNVQVKDRWRFADLEVVLQKLEDKYLAGTAVRDIGLTIAGGEPPVWSQYQYKDGKQGGGSSPSTGSPILAVSMSTKGSSGGGGGKKKPPSSPRPTSRGSSLRVGSPAKATSSPTRTPLGSPRSRSRKAQTSSPSGRVPQDLTGIGVNFTGAGGFGSARLKAQNSLRGRLPFGN